MEKLHVKLLGLLLTGFLTVLSFSVYGQTTIKGEVLDLSCYMSNGSKGKGHKMCAQGCLDKGLPAGILGDNGKVYLLLENHKKSEAYKKVLEHAAENVEITGKVVDNGGVQALIVEEVKLQG